MPPELEKEYIMEIREFRVGNTVQKTESKEETQLSLHGLSLIDLYCDKPGCPYEPKELTDDWLENSRGFVRLQRDEDILAYKGEFFLVKTKDGYEYLPTILSNRTIGEPKKYCHEVENLYHDLFGYPDKTTD